MNDLMQTVEEPEREPAAPIPAESMPHHIGRYRVERILGKGGFGLVYLANDDQLQRPVAVKVSHLILVSRSEEAEAYLSEARAVAKLDHPNIVPVYDVGSTEQFPCFIVSKFIDGMDLSTRLKQSRLSIIESVELVKTVAEALHHAHKQGLVHRDIKPGNILLDKKGEPFVVDFGLALQEQDVGIGSRYAGTPAYMSPEQARGEGHRVDGRSDIFSLGMVFYELLTGRRPFQADSRAELLEQIAQVEARPPRQIDDRLPKELERVCLKALSKRASDRYTTARDLADDLRHFLAAAFDDEKSVVTGRQQQEAEVGTPLPTPVPALTDRQAVKIVPKGLRSFDAADADFFLELLAGPRDRDGLPDSIRFWKTRIETTDADNTFAVGLIYGPSGCGKSSLVKAGLLPRLARSVTAVYVEATGAETEARLVKNLRRQVADLPDDLRLTESLVALRQGRYLAAGQKVLLVLDQFEQWLHAKRKEENTELVHALRHCDGERLQCIVLVRDDFGMAATRFMAALDIPILQGNNFATVDLFDPRHARKVLAAFGRAFGALPAGGEGLRKDQEAFLDQSVAGLAQDGKVISVRLALFAEMVKGKPWHPATLKEVGGIEGVGVTFLEETFSASTAPPQHRLHQSASQAVLKALLPESGAGIKGKMRSQQELLAVSGYASQPRDFEELLRILDGELRLLTPTDPEGKDDADPSTLQAGSKYYQLTHDYLVPSLREWLTRKQGETRRGRAQLRLAERTALWNSKKENRFLPFGWEWLTLRLLTNRRDWTSSQREMMGRAARYYEARAALLLAVLVLMLGISWEAIGQLRARVLLDRVLEASTDDIAAIVEDMGPYRHWLNGPLREACASAEANGDSRRQLHASLALLPVDPSQVRYLCDRLKDAKPQELMVIREALKDHADEATPRMWEILADGKRAPSERLRAACFVAAYAPDDDRWQGVSRDVAARLVAEDRLEIVRWAEALRPVGRHLLQPLATLLVENKSDAASRRMITRLYGEYAEGLPDAFAPLEKEAAGENGAVVNPNDRLAPQRQEAIAAATLAALGRWEPALRLLPHQLDPTVRSYLIDQLGQLRADARMLESLLTEDHEVSLRRAALLALGEFDRDGLPLPTRERLIPRLAQLHHIDADPGVRGAAAWLLGQWQRADQLAQTDQSLTIGRPVGNRRWFLNAQGQTFVLLAPGQFQRGKGAGCYRGRVEYLFALAAREVTVAEFFRFRKKHSVLRNYAPTDDCPVNGVSWYDAAAYCNWLSKQDNIPEDQWCYEPNAQGKYAEGMRAVPDLLRRSGYRLPTAAEWEYACRAGSAMRWSIGEAEDLLSKYAWCFSNASSRSHPVGTLRPNDLGLFDMHGNAWEWCQDRADNASPDGRRSIDGVITDAGGRVVRGGAFGHGPPSLQAGSEISMSAKTWSGDIGFRPARTVLLPGRAKPPSQAETTPKK